jgi:hypothetical protein
VQHGRERHDVGQHPQDWFEDVAVGLVAAS